MNKRQLAAEVAKQAGISQVEASKLISATLDTIAQTLRNGERVSLSGFGTFEVQAPVKEAESAGVVVRQTVFSPDTRIKASGRPKKTEMDKRWEKSFTTSTDALDEMSERALKEYRAGRTMPLNPDKL